MKVKTLRLNLKPVTSGSLLFHFCCHFGPKIKSGQISKKNPVILSFSSWAK
ncbi:hypothetical protein HanPSC8_Chr03g0094891 [Helianthus annuus]|nr:hypothetical protein HanPSC8_Chr03g0094891 [Helianthus annuus]